MTAAVQCPPLVRKGQRWTYQGQRWAVHEVLADGVIVLIGPAQFRDLQGVTADELYAAGRLEQEAPAPDKATERLAKAFEAAQLRFKSPKRKRAAKPKPPAAPYAWRAIVLAVDCAANSGWSMWADGILIAWGELSKDDDKALLALCVQAHGIVIRDQDRPAVLVLEQPSGFVYAGHGANVLVGLGAAREAWHRAWRDAGGVLKRRVHIKPTQWRAELFGSSSKRYSKGYPVMERQMAELSLKEFSHLVPGNDNALSGDVCAGICIGRWAVRAGQVGEALPVSLRIFV